MARITDSRGMIEGLLLPLMLVSVFLVVSVSFGVWAYSSRSDYKNRSDQKSAAAVKAAVAQEDILKDKQHAEADKLPLKTYIGPEQYGSLHVSYPKTWSGFISSAGTSNQPLDSYFHPDVVLGVQSQQGNIFALRAQVINQSYSSVLLQYNGGVTTKALTATPYAFPKVPSVVGVRYDGVIDSTRKVTGSIIVVPIRDKTLKISTESQTFLTDFNTIILPNISFSP